MSIEMSSRGPADPQSSPSRTDRSEKKHTPKKDKKSKKRHGSDDADLHTPKSKKHRSEKKTERHPQLVLDPVTDVPVNSPFHTQTSSLYLPLAPISQRTPLEGLCAEHLSPLILTYFPPFHGVILSYSNPRLSARPFEDNGGVVAAQCIDEYAVSWTWVTAEFLLFRPERGVTLEGYINLQHEGHVGLVCWNLFNAVIERNRLPRDWEWAGVEDMEANADGDDEQNYAEEGSGYYVDGNGNKIDGLIKFKIKDFESSHDRRRGFLSISGTMLNDDEENELMEEEISARSSRNGFTTKRFRESKTLGATNLGVPVESNQDGMDGDRSLKHRREY